MSAIRNRAQDFPLVLAALGGVYFGLFSCGGYAWHRTAFFLALLALSLVAMFPQTSRSTLKRILLLLPIAPTFLLARALASPFHAAMPDSVHRYLELVLQSAEYGPC